MIDYALWEVIENDATLPKKQVVDGIITMMPIITAEEKVQRKLEVKAISTLMMGISNEHQLKFNSIKDVKQLLKAVEKKFGFKSCTNGAVNTAQAFNTANEVSTASTQVNVAFSTNIDNLSDDVICAFLASQPNSPQLAHKDLEQIHSYDMEEMDLRWKMVMLTMRARRECRALRNQDNKHKECTRRSMHVETPVSIALVSCDGLGRYDWSDQAEKGPNYALMAYTSSSSDSKISNDSTCLQTVKLLKSQNEQLLKDLKKYVLMVLAYKTDLKSVEERLKFFKKNEFIYLEDIKVLKVEIQMKKIAIKKIGRKLKVAQKEKDDIQLTVEKLKNASKSLNKLIDCQIIDNCKKGLGYENYNAVPPPYKKIFMPSKPDLSFTSLDEFANKPIAENNKSSEEESKAVRKNNNAPIIKEWVSDDEEENVTQPNIEKKIVKPSIVRKEFVKPRHQEKTTRKTVKKVEHNRQNTHRPRGNQRNWNNIMSQKLGSNFKMFNKACYGNPQMNLQDKEVIDSGRSRHITENMSYLTSYEEINKGYVAFEGNPKGGKITGKCAIKTGTKDETNGILKSFITRIENLVDHKVEVVNSACYVQNKVLVVKPHNKTPYELFHGRTPTLSFMRPFGCPVTILNTKDHLGKFDGKADEGFFVGYFLNSKAFRVFNSRTRIVEENLYIRFSENTPNVVGSRPDWLYDIDALTRIMSYELIVVGTQSNGCADSKSSQDDEFKPSSDDGKKVDEDPSKGNECYDQENKVNVNKTNNVNIVSLTVNAAGTNGVNAVGELPFDPDMPALEDVGIFDFSNKDEDDNAVADMNNLDTTIQVSPTPTTRTNKINLLVKNKKDEKRIMIRNNERLLAQRYTQEEGIDYDKVFAPVVRIEAIRLFLAYASFKDFVVYQMDVKSIFLYGKIEEKVYVCQPPGVEDQDFPDRVYQRIGKGFSRRITSLFPTMVVQSQLGESLVMPTVPHHTPTILQTSSSQAQKTHKPRKPKRKNTQVPHPSGSIEHVADEAVYKKLDDRLVRPVTTTSSLEAEQDSGAKKPWRIPLLKLGLRMYLNIPMIHCSQKGRRIDDIDADEDITLLSIQADVEMFDADKDLDGEEAKGVVIQETSESPITTTTIPKQKSQDKGKGIMVEEPVKPKKKEQIRLDEEVALKLQAKFDEEEQRLARERELKKN
nr:retrovirus-related Pol polyprotein from transposon TNT 1-94 [Tanacetum cinerariifolium]